MHQLRWIDDLGNENVQSFPTEKESREAVAGVEGAALVSPTEGGPVSVFRDGREVSGDEAVDVIAKWEHRLQIGISRPEVPDTDPDPDDLTGYGFQAGFPAQWGWRVWKGSEGATDWSATSNRGRTLGGERRRRRWKSLTWPGSPSSTSGRRTSGNCVCFVESELLDSSAVSSV